MVSFASTCAVIRIFNVVLLMPLVIHIRLLRRPPSTRQSVAAHT